MSDRSRSDLCVEIFEGYRSLEHGETTPHGVDGETTLGPTSTALSAPVLGAVIAVSHQ